MNRVENVGNYLTDLLSSIDGFDYRWTSLITSTPLLFEDIDYFRCHTFVNNRCTQEEIDAYRSGKLRELYPTFESLLMCNLSHYDRIMSFCTMVFYKYIRLPNGDTTNAYLKDVPMLLEMTPTKIWCCAMTSTSSTDWELNYAWGSNKSIIKQKPEGDKSWLEANYKTIYSKNRTFQRFVEYCALRTDSTGFVRSYYADKTSNTRLSNICSKFTKTTTAIDVNQLETLPNLIKDDWNVIQNLSEPILTALSKMFNSDKEYVLYVFNTEFYIFSKKFKMKIQKEYDVEQKLPYISKQYLSNSYECFIAEGLMTDTIRSQIAWAKNQLNPDNNYILKILEGLLLTMLNEDYRQIRCVKKMEQSGAYSEVTFSGVFRNVYIIEKMYYNNTVAFEHRKCLSKENAAKYLIERGYYVFGIHSDMQELMSKDFRSVQFSKKHLINHYSKYCIPVQRYMEEIVEVHKQSLREITEVLLCRDFPVDKLSKVTSMTELHAGFKPKKIMNIMKPTGSQQYQTYYNAINN